MSHEGKQTDISDEVIRLWGISCGTYTDHWFPLKANGQRPFISLEPPQYKVFMNIGSQQELDTKLTFHICNPERNAVQWSILRSQILKICTCTDPTFNDSPFLRSVVLVLNKHQTAYPQWLDSHFEGSHLQTQSTQFEEYCAEPYPKTVKLCFLTLFLDFWNFQIFAHLVGVHIISRLLTIKSQKDYHQLFLSMLPITQETYLIWTAQNKPIQQTSLYASVFNIATRTTLPHSSNATAYALWIMPHSSHQCHDVEHWIDSKMKLYTVPEKDEMLNDEFINLCTHLQYTSWSSQMQSQVYLFDVLKSGLLFKEFLPKLLKQRSQPQISADEISSAINHIIRQTRKDCESFFTKKVIVIPLQNETLKHWILYLVTGHDVVFSQSAKQSGNSVHCQVYRLESLNCMNEQTDPFLNLVCEWLNIQAKRTIFIPNQNSELFHVKVPKQHKLKNCGWYMLQNIRKSASATPPFSFDDQDLDKTDWYIKQTVQEYMKEIAEYISLLHSLQKDFLNTFKQCYTMKNSQ